MENPGRMAQADLRRIERCRDQLEDARAGLLVAIVQARASGETLRDIAKAAGISHQRVHAIVQAQAKARREP